MILCDFLPFDIDDETDPAGIVFKLRIIKTLLQGPPVWAFQNLVTHPSRCTSLI